MKITKLELTNFRCFEHYELNLSDRFNLLIGDNGSGKTAILDAIAIASGDLLHTTEINKLSERNRIDDDDMRFIFKTMGQTITKETAETTKLRILGIIDRKDFNVTHDKFGQTESIQGSALIKQKLEDKTNSNILFPIIIHYGTNRLWQRISSLDIETLPPDSRLLGYKDCLNTASNLKQILRWFKTQELAALQKKQRRHVLEAVREAIIKMIPDTKNVFWDMDWDELIIETEIQGKLQSLPFRLLSDGYRNMIGIVADIAYRMATLNPQLEKDVIQQTEGIVLIDEIDLHLHPKWQRIVVERLLNTFPKVQFVATTHSPFIIQSLRSGEQLIMLEGQPTAQLANKSIEEIAQGIMGVENITRKIMNVENPEVAQRYMEMKTVAKHYLETLEEAAISPEEKLEAFKQRLSESIAPYADNPAFQAILEMERVAKLGE